MRLTRVYIDQPLAPGARVTLPENAGAHLVRVLRLRACLWERRQSRLQSSTIVARRDLRRSHKRISARVIACA